jgi:hypothetical protein
MMIATATKTGGSLFRRKPSRAFSTSFMASQPPTQIESLSYRTR